MTDRCATAFAPGPLLPSHHVRRPRLAPTAGLETTGLSRRRFARVLAAASLSLLPRLNPAALGAEPATAPVDDTPSFTKLPCPPGRPDCRPVEVRDYRLGSGPEARPGARLVLRWTGRLADRYGWPFQRDDADADVVVTLGKDRLISGFEQGVLGMRAGGKRRILIPGEFGYMSEADGPVPGDYGDRRRLWATVLNKRRFKRAGDLVIDVQLKKVRLP